MSEKEPLSQEISLKEPYMDRVILHAGFSSTMRLLYALYAQGQKGGPLTKDEISDAMCQGEKDYLDALEREKKQLQGKYPPFDSSSYEK